MNTTQTPVLRIPTDIAFSVSDLAAMAGVNEPTSPVAVSWLVDTADDMTYRLASYLGCPSNRDGWMIRRRMVDIHSEQVRDVVDVDVIRGVAEDGLHPFRRCPIQ